MISNPLVAKRLDEFHALTRLVWTRCGAAAEHVAFLQTREKPYLIAYRKVRVTCSRYCILLQLYDAQGLQRTAQHFLVTPVDMGAEESMNVINAHAPPGTSIPPTSTGPARRRTWCAPPDE